MTAMARHLDNLGPDFEQRWKRSSRGRKRELIGELRDLYIFLEEEGMPLLAGQAANAASAQPHPEPSRATAKKTPAVSQGTLFAETPAKTHAAEPVARPENPFLPKSVLDRLQESQNQVSAGLRELMHSTGPSTPASHEQVDLERELRLKLGPMVESLIEARLDAMKSELRVRMRAEMDKLIAEHIRKS